MWKNMVLDARIKLAERNIKKWKENNEITDEYIEQQKKVVNKRSKELTKQKELNHIQLKELARKKAEIENQNHQLQMIEQENDALEEVLLALEEIEIDQVPNTWKGELRSAIEKGEVAQVKDKFLTILRSHSLYGDGEIEDMYEENSETYED